MTKFKTKVWFFSFNFLYFTKPICRRNGWNFKKKGKYSKLVLEFPNAAVAICRYLQKCVSPYTCMNTLLTVGNAGKCPVPLWVPSQPSPTKRRSVTTFFTYSVFFSPVFLTAWTHDSKDKLISPKNSISPRYSIVKSYNYGYLF